MSRQSEIGATVNSVAFGWSKRSVAAHTTNQTATMPMTAPVHSVTARRPIDAGSTIANSAGSSSRPCM